MNCVCYVSFVEMYKLCEKPKIATVVCGRMMTPVNAKSWTVSQNYNVTMDQM